MRYSQSVLRALAAAAFAAPLVAGSIVGSLSPAAAAVYSPQQALPGPTIQQFLANPSGLLSQFPNGGPDLAKMVRDLAASDPQTLSALIGLLRGASPSQASAIGTGLGQAAELAVDTDPTYATEIQTAVVTASNDLRWSPSARSLAATSNSRPRAAVGAAAVAVRSRPVRMGSGAEFLAPPL